MGLSGPHTGVLMIIHQGHGLPAMREEAGHRSADGQVARFHNGTEILCANLQRSVNLQEPYSTDIIFLFVLWGAIPSVLAFESTTVGLILTWDDDFLLTKPLLCLTKVCSFPTSTRLCVSFVG